MTTLVTIKNDGKSNGDVIVDAASTCEGPLRGVPLRPGESKDIWITTSSSIHLTETWPTRQKNNDPGGGKTIAECGDNGEKWAKAFTDHFPAADEDTMRAWFQNAIEASHTVRVERVADEAARVLRATQPDLSVPAPGELMTLQTEPGEFVKADELAALRDKAWKYDELSK